MSEKDIIKIFKKIKKHLPYKLPDPKIIIHKSKDSLISYYYLITIDENGYDYHPYAFCDPIENTIHLHRDMDSDEEIAFFILHEIAHLYAYSNYGPNDIRCCNYDVSERYADTFAYKWVDKLIERGIVRALKY